MREEIGYVPVGEAELYVEDVGPVEGPALFVLHGGPGGNAYVLREGLQDYLEGFRVVYFDQRGSGRSLELPQDPRLFTVDALVEDTLLLAEALGVERFGLLAHGFGAVVALEVLRRFPQAEGAILLAPWVNFPWLAARLAEAAGLAPSPTRRRTSRRPSSGRSPRPSLTASCSPPPGADGLRVARRGGGDFGFGRARPRLPAQRALAPGLHPLPHPGAPPPLRPRGGAGRDELPLRRGGGPRLRAPIRVLPEAGHYLWIDAPEAFEEAFKEALAALVPALRGPLVD